MKTMRKSNLIVSLLLVAVVLITAFVLCLQQNIEHEREIEEIRESALEKLERDKGTYDERSIVLGTTSKAEAEELAERLGAELRITENGRFARLTLPEGLTIRDIMYYVFIV